ncbi:MAG: efflux RND transporter periplasmic adaptor subunit [Myxococcota bacterium]
MTRLAFASLLWAAVVATGCAKGAAEPGEVTQPAEQADKKDPATGGIRVEVAQLAPSAASTVLRLPGEVEGGRDALLASSQGGFVESVPVDEGDQVQRNQVLVRVDSQLRAAAVQQSKAELAAAERELDRAERQGDAIPDAQRDAAETRLASAKAAHRTASIQLSRAVVRAPFDGVVAEVKVEQGEVAAPGAPIVRLVQLDPAIISLSVADRDVVALRPGAGVHIRTDARGAVYEGEVTRISPAADLETRTVRVEVEVPNPDGELLPGMIATVEVGSRIDGDHLLLPQHVLVTRRKGNGLFVLDDGKARWRPVELGEVLGGQVVVKDGVAPGDRVVVTGHRELVDGDRVIVAREGTCCTEGRVRFEER